jgi:RNA polymerase sigma-70 factor, ECF subfamily
MVTTSPDRELDLGRLMALAQGGDRAAYEALLTALARAARPLAARRLPADRVDDGVQNVLLAVHRARHTYDPARPFGPWFLALAHHRLTDTWRQVARASRREADEAEPWAWPEPPERHDALLGAVSALPTRQRRVVELLKLEQRSVREVARILDMSESAVKVTAHRAYRSLRRTLGVADVQR